MTTEKRANAPLLVLAVVAAVAAGYVGATALGATLWLPLLGAVLLFAGLRYGMGRDTAVSLAIAGLGGHALWIVAGAMAIPGALPLVMVDVVLNLFLILWLLVRPGYAVAAMILLYELFGLATNLVGLQNAPQSDPMALLHIAIRLVIIAAAIGVIRLVRQSATITTTGASQ